MNNDPIANVVLFTPEIPQNTGNIIRLCANVGATLHLIKPLGFNLEDSGLKRAALDYRDLADVVLHESIEAFFSSTNAGKIYAAVTGGDLDYTEPHYQIGDTIIFGPESGRLSNEIISQLGPDSLIRIPMMPANRSLNLSNAVAVVVYEMWRQSNFWGSV